MINHKKWISSLPKINKEISKTINQLDHENSINSIPKKDSYNSVKKYTLLTVLFTCGLIFVSIVKNETRNLQKDINNLETSINLIKFNLDQAFLDHEIITSPENISLLAKKHLNIDLAPYKRSQIKQLNAENEKFTKINKTKKELEIKELKYTTPVKRHQFIKKRRFLRRRRIQFTKKSCLKRPTFRCKTK